MVLAVAYLAQGGKARDKEAKTGKGMSGTRDSQDRFVSGNGTAIYLIPNEERVRTLWEENWGKISARNFTPVLNNERKNNMMLDILWRDAEEWYRDCNMARYDFTFSNRYGASFHNQEFHEFLLAIIAYTMEGVYQDFNNECRDLAMGKLTWENFHFKSLWFLLHFSVPQLPDDIREDVTLYRVIDGYFPDAQQAIDKKTPVSINAGFSSFSRKKEEALRFLNSSMSHPCLQIIRGRPNYAGSLTHYSIYSHEEEVLVCPQSLFTVISSEKLSETTQGVKYKIQELEPWSGQERL